MYEQATSTTFGGYRRGIPAKNDGAVVINTGLSVVTASGHLINLARDNQERVAFVCVSATPAARDTTQEELKQAADMLAARARRCLGPAWNVVEWYPDTLVEPEVNTLNVTVPGKVAGYKEEAWRSGV